MIRIVLLAAVTFCLSEADPSGYLGGGYGYAAPHNGFENSVNKNNAARQLAVNNVAQHVGSGTGTANKDGVPGTVLGVTGRDGYSYGRGYGYGGRGYGGIGGYGAYGYPGYGGFAGYGRAGYGRAGYGAGGYGAGAYGYNLGYRGAGLGVGVGLKYGGYH